MTRRQTIVSTPGKVLLTGGYLVLEEKPGLVLSLDSRFTVEINDSNDQHIQISSPQFENGVWNMDENGTILSGSPNKYIQASVKYSFMCIKELIPNVEAHSLRMNIIGDDNFYSETATSVEKVKKTGLGSSAALVTGVVGCLLSHFLYQIDLDLLQVIHNLSQFVHCLVQGKVGSGFDVSAAVYGSQIYYRFSPLIIQEALDLASTDSLSGDLLTQLVLRKWDSTVTSFDLPFGLQLILGDVQKGSDSPKMASKLLKWRLDNPELSQPIWNSLESNNQKFIELMVKLNSLHDRDPQAYGSVMEKCSIAKISSIIGAKEEVLVTLSQIHSTFENIRSDFRRLSVEANVPIEPPEQTAFCDASLQIPGVILAGVPGAGGFDALFCISISEKPLDNLRNMWSSISNNRIRALTSRISRKGIEIKSNQKLE